MHYLEVLKRPVVTEKSTLLQERGKYAFEVDPSATKPQVKEAVEKVFNVNVIAVNIMNKVGKRKRYGPRWVDGKAWKKAIVTLKTGDKIQIFEGA